MKVLRSFNYTHILHYLPLHYLPFILRTNSIKSKQSLLADGFSPLHFRSMSSRTDLARGFYNYIHFTLKSFPRILQAKLTSGFPHIELMIPISDLDSNTPYDLCRYNIAMTRRLPTSPNGGFVESDHNGRYYGDLLVPIARDTKEKTALLDKHSPLGTMIEVLIPSQINVPENSLIRCFSARDLGAAKDICSALSSNISLALGNETYESDPTYVDAVSQFIERTFAEPTWKGNGLEFDRL
jgi:hypothetical protein